LETDERLPVNLKRETWVWVGTLILLRVVSVFLGVMVGVFLKGEASLLQILSMSLLISLERRRYYISKLGTYFLLGCFSFLGLYFRFMLTILSSMIDETSSVLTRFDLVLTLVRLGVFSTCEMEDIRSPSFLPSLSSARHFS
jgi:O-antigen ligase